MARFSKPMKKFTLVSSLSVLLVGAAVAFTVVMHVSAAIPPAPPDYTTPRATGCALNQINSSGPIGGYEYRTFDIAASLPGSTVGDTMVADCTFPSGWSGLSSDQIWFGPEVPGVWTASRSSLPACAAPPIDVPNIDLCPNSQGNSNYEVLQDDASVAWLNGNSGIYCNSMQQPFPSGSPTYSGCAGPDIYAHGYEGKSINGTPYRGAGFYNGPARDISSFGNRNADGTLQDFNIKILARNTWSGGFGANYTFTLRYRLSTGIVLTPDCGAKTVHVAVTGALSGVVNYQIGLVAGSRASSSFDIDMSGFDPSWVLTVMANANVNGVATSGSTVYSCPGAGGGLCPLDPTLSANGGNVTVPLLDKSLDQSRNNYGFSTAYNFNPLYFGPDTGTASLQWEQRIPLNQTPVTATSDVTGVGSPITTPSPKPLPVVSSGYQTATISYAPFINTYPYDQNQGAVTYDSVYTSHRWVSSSSPDGYRCDTANGWQLSGTNCLKYSPASGPYYNCPSGWNGPTLTGYGWLCYYDSYYSASSYASGGYYYCSWPYSGPYSTGYGLLCKDSAGNWAGGASYQTTYSYSCSSGDTLSGSTCTHRYWTPANSYYTCSSGQVLTATGYGWLCLATTPATPYYNWHDLGSSTQRMSDTANATPMNRCYDRNFDISPSFNNTSFAPDPESPTSVNFGVHLQTAFTQQPGISKSMRRPYKVTTNVTLAYVVNRPGVGQLVYPMAPLGRIGGSSSNSSQCGNLSGASSNVTLTGNTSSSDSLGCDYVESYSAAIPPLQTGDEVCVAAFTVAPAVGSMSDMGALTSIIVASRSAPGAGGGNACTTSRIVDMPYLRIYSADVRAGEGFTATVCNSGNGQIAAFNRGIGPGYVGSGAQLGVSSTSGIIDFISSSLRPSGRPKALSFANTSGTYGGNFGFTSQCVPDYWSDAASGFAAIGNQTIPGSIAQPGAPINPINISSGFSQQKAIYIDGTLRINGDITYNQAGWNVSNNGNTSTVPSLYVIVRGDIYITEAVRQLDGNYIALPRSDGTGGNIYTCGGGTGPTPYSTSEIIANCTDAPLKVNGMFLAKRVKFLRMYSSLRSGTAGESPTSNSPLAASCIVRNGAAIGPAYVGQRTCAAEEFTAGPETWLSMPDNSSLTNFKIDFDAFTSLPPIL